jgi:hypothetical protein
VLQEKGGIKAAGVLILKILNDEENILVNVTI